MLHNSAQRNAFPAAIMPHAVMVLKVSHFTLSGIGLLCCKVVVHMPLIPNRSLYQSTHAQLIPVCCRLCSAWSTFCGLWWNGTQQACPQHSQTPESPLHQWVRTTCSPGRTSPQRQQASCLVRHLQRMGWSLAAPSDPPSAVTHLCCSP